MGKNNGLGGPALVTTLAALLLVAPAARAQDSGAREEADFSMAGAQLKIGDAVVLTLRDGTTVRGRVADLTNAGIAVAAKDGRRDIPGDQVMRVERRRNGILLGAIIGAGVGVGFGLALKSYAHNEGGSETGALLFPIGVGLGTGIAIDALLVRPRTVFERVPSTQARVVFSAGPRRVVAQMSIRY